jgi:signal transduction histidine kinase/ActR/RegA family two-component response regulator
VGELSAFDLLRTLDEELAGKTGEAFFPQLVRALAASLKASCAFVSEIDGERYRANVLAMWNDGAFSRTFSYDLSGTPCECVLSNEIVAFPRRIQELFPADRDGLARLGAESFLAIPLCPEHGKVAGHIAVLDREERDWSEADFGVLRIFSARAGAELDRRRYERRLESMNQALESANDELRRELAQRLEAEQQLLEARRNAEAANQAKSQFLAHMSHELRTPLNGILGYAQLMKRDSLLSSDHKEAVGVIESSGEHLLTLINELLDLAKIESGRLILAQQAFDLPQLLKQVADVASVRAREANLGFSCELDGALPQHVRGDERALRQVLLNLLGNAVKFTPRGRVAFRVQVTRRLPHHCGFSFAIEDSGPGIPAEDRERIFEPFTRITRDPRVEGTGLGLPISRRLTEAMGGRLTLVSHAEQGSTFTVELELALAASVAPGPEVARQVIGYAGPRRRVIVVDDDARSRTVLARLLEAVGLQVSQCDRAAAALDIAADQRFDGLVTDLAMPQMSGLELIRAWRAQERLRDIPVLAVSASASAVSRVEAIAAGCDAFLTKPVHAEELYTSIGHLLRLTWQTSSAVAVPSPAAPPLEGILFDERRAHGLYDLAMKGDVRELMAQAEEAARRDPAGEPLYREVQARARRFDMRGVRGLLQSVLASMP